MRRASAGAVLVLLGACGPQSFQPQFKARPMPSEQTVLAEVSSAKPRDERPVAVGITTAQRLFAWDLSAGLLWERPVRAKSAPIVVADGIVLHEADGITVRDLSSGDVRAVVDEEGELVGADGEGRAIVVSIAYQSGDARSAVAYVDGNSVRWKQSLQMPAGVPALINGRVLVPWATQRLTVLDAKDGAEVVRWHMNNTVIGQARVDRGRVYVGQLGLMRLDARILQDGTDPAVYTPFKRTLPGQPAMLRDGYAKVPEPDNAQHRLQLDWRIGAAEGEMSAENDLLALRFYRLLFALDARSDAIRWVRTFDHDLVGAAIEPGGLFVADAAGTLSFLDTSGATRLQRDLGRPLQVLAIRPGGWAPAADAAAAPVAPAADASKQPQPAAPAAAAAPSMQEQLYAAATLPDDRLAAGRAYAVEHLARLPDEAVTANLVAICSDGRSPEPVQLAACGHLGERENGGSQIVEALRRRASFLEGTEPPPVGALAQAAGEMQLKQAAPLLVSHMEDPNTPAADLVPVLQTLERLGHKPAASAIERFVRMHHAEPDGSELAPALHAAMHALGALRARGSRGSLDELARDPLTPQTMRDKAREAIALMEAAPAPAKPETAPAKAPEAEAEADAEREEEVQTDPRPYSLSPDMVRDALKPLRGKLAACLGADATKPHSGRVSMVVDAQGRVEGVFVTPTTLQACVEAGLQGARFPATRLGRQRVTHTVLGPNAAEAGKSDKAKRDTADPGKGKPGAAKPAKPAKKPVGPATKPAAAKTAGSAPVRTPAN